MLGGPGNGGAEAVVGTLDLHVARALQGELLIGRQPREGGSLLGCLLAPPCDCLHHAGEAGLCMPLQASSGRGRHVGRGEPNARRLAPCHPQATAAARGTLPTCAWRRRRGGGGWARSCWTQCGRWRETGVRLAVLAGCARGGHRLPPLPLWLHAAVLHSAALLASWIPRV